MVLGAACPFSASAQSPGSVSTITVALTATYSAPALAAKDENGKIIPVADGGGPVYENSWSINKVNANDDPVSDEEVSEQGTKVITAKYSNKEILLDMLANEFLPGIGGKPATIAGWSIMQVNENAEPGAISLGNIIARHTSGETVEVPMSWAVVEEVAAAVTVGAKSSSKTTYPSNPELEPKTTSSETYNSTFKTVGSLELIAGADLSGEGLLTGGSKLMFVLYKEDGETFREPLYVPLAAKLSGILGSALISVEIGEETEASAVIEGSISAAAGKVYADLEAYLSPPEL